MSVTSRQVTANVRLWLYVETLQVIVSILIQYIRYVYETPNLPPFCTFSVLFCRQARVERYPAAAAAAPRLRILAGIG
jgi:hypothetical protein